MGSRHAFSDSSKIWVVQQMDDLSNTTTGIQVFISESALYRTQLKIWVGYQKAYTVERFGPSSRWTTSKTQRRAPGMHIRAPLEDLMCPPDGHMLKYQEGAQVFISESGLYLLTSRRVRVRKDGVFA